MDLSFYAAPGPLTSLSDEQRGLIRALRSDALGLCRVAQGLVVLPAMPNGSDLSDTRLAERNLRPAQAILARALERSGRALTEERSLRDRVVGTCRHFAVLSTAFLRAIGVPARARCGFATYFQPAQRLDHWITEYWSRDDERWIRVDSEILDLGVVAQPHDLHPGQFLTGGEAWQLVREGAEDASTFGVGGTGNWGPAEIRGDAIRDLAALVKLELLPWDEWGPMRDSYDGATGDDFDRTIDDLADACRGDDLAAVHEVYRQFVVPPELIQ